MVLIKVTALQRVSNLNAKWGMLKLRESKTGKIETLRDQSSSGTLYSIFAGPLPAGIYTVDGFDAEGAMPLTFGLPIGMMISAMTADSQMNSAKGSFTVEVGHFTNLGVMLTSVGNKSQSVVVSDDASLQAALADLDASSQARLRAMPIRSWNIPADANQREVARSMVRTSATRVTMDSTADGRVYVATPMGDVQQRDPSGVWTTLSTGSSDNINLVRALPDGRLLAASDSPRYYLRALDGSWLQARVPGGLQITAVEPLGTQGFALLTQKFGAPGMMPRPAENHVLIAADLAHLEAAREVPSMPAASPDDSSPFLFYDGDRLLVWINHFGFSRTGDLFRIDPATLQVVKERMDFWGLGTYRTPGGLVVRERMNGLSRFVDFSSDNGKTWQRGEQGGPLASRFVDAVNGWGVDKVSTGWNSITATLTRTSDGGKTWHTTGRPIEMNGPAQLLVAGPRVLIYTGLNIVSTEDAGKSWQVEWPRPQ